MHLKILPQPKLTEQEKIDIDLDRLLDIHSFEYWYMKEVAPKVAEIIRILGCDDFTDVDPGFAAELRAYIKRKSCSIKRRYIVMDRLAEIYIQSCCFSSEAYK